MRIRLASKVLKFRGRYCWGKVRNALQRLGFRLTWWNVTEENEPATAGHCTNVLCAAPVTAEGLDKPCVLCGYPVQADAGYLNEEEQP